MTKPLSLRRQREFRGRLLRRLFGSLKARTQRWHDLVRRFGRAEALKLSRRGDQEKS